MRRTALDMVGGWDAHNVTEDADLSYRLAAYGWELGYITLPTQEEAVSNWKDWHYQRSRWMKGYMQTWAVHMRTPFSPGGFRGISRFFTLQLTVGMTVMSSLLHLPILMFLASYYLYKDIIGERLIIPQPFILSLGISYAVGILIGMIGAFRSGKPRLALSAVFMPIYWLMLCAPTLRALWELRYDPFHWHKTEHGVKPPASKTLNAENGRLAYELIG